MRRGLHQILVNVAISCGRGQNKCYSLRSIITEPFVKKIVLEKLTHFTFQ